MLTRRTRTALTLIALVLGTGLSGVLMACGGGPEDTSDPTEESAEQPAGARVEVVATGLEVPWEIAFVPGGEGEALITERPGRVRLLTPDGLTDEPVAEVDVEALGEGGLLGLAFDPEFERNRFVYLYYTTADGMVLERRSYESGDLAPGTVVLEGIEAGEIHDSGRIAFGPDERLYVATGDAGQEELAQDPESLNGKFLRLEPAQYRGDGAATPEVLTSGHRNPQGFDWDPSGGELYSSEHGDVGNDEVNLLREGANYGWPLAEGPDHGEFEPPVALYEEAIAPSGATFVSEPGSAWTGDFLVAALTGEQLRRLRFESGEAVIDEPLFEGDFGRLRAVVEGPDGAIYALTSNRDGRGDAVADDDRVIRIEPPPAG